jgi:apolipoprotein N-acyltransferase
MKIIHTHPKLIALLAGALAALGFQPLGLWPLTLFGVAILCHQSFHAQSWRQLCALSWLWGFGHFFVNSNWIAPAFQYQNFVPLWAGWVAVALLAAILALHPMLAAMGTRLVMRSLSRNTPSTQTAYILCFAGLWVLSEYARGTWFSGYGWNPLSIALLNTGLRWGAPWLGTYALSGIIVLLAGLGWLCMRKAQRITAAAYIVLLLVSWAFGIWPSSMKLETPAYMAVQPNIGVLQQRQSSDVELVQRLVQASVPQGKANPPVLFWPETIVPDYLDKTPKATEVLSNRLAARSLRRTLVTGAISAITDAQEKIVGARNSVLVISPQGKVVARYDKAHLVPGGEYLPLRGLLSRLGLKKLTQGAFDLSAGAVPGRVLALPQGQGRMGVIICYEAIFSGEVTDHVERPDFIFNAGDDAWYGAWGPVQHLAQVQMRALEEGLPILRSTPTGISAYIDAQGYVRDAVPMGEVGAAYAPQLHAVPPTFFSVYGNNVAIFFALGLILISILAMRSKRLI